MCDRGILFFSLVTLLITRLSFVESQRNFSVDQYVNQAERALLSLYPADPLKLLSKLSTDDFSRGNSSRCQQHVELLLESMKNGTMWALKMIDASSKIPSGILQGNRMDLGMYDECIGIREIQNGEEIRGRHCMYTLEMGINYFQIKESLSICLPSSCEPEDVRALLQTGFDMIGTLVETEIALNVTETTCSPLETPNWTTGGIVTLVGFSVLLLFLVLCTIADVYVRNSTNHYSSKNRLVWLSQFSFYTNAVRILSTKATPQTLPALQGLRFFSMCWVIIGHGYVMYIAAPTVNLIKFTTWVHTWEAVYIVIAPFSVDTFFTISGFLISYLFLKETSTGRRFNIFAYYIHRYLRLTPAFAALLLMMIFIVPRLGSGALWSTLDFLSNNCRYNWWPMLLYVHNYVDKEHLMCLPHTWYLAVEMQFFWISPLILYPLAKKPRLGLVVLALGFIASIITPAVIAHENKYSEAPFAGGDMELSARTNAEFYLQTHNRAAPWLIGIFVGYLVFVSKGTPGNMTKRIGWLITSLALAFCVFSIRVFQKDGYVYDTAWETFYIIVSKPLWASAIGWIIYASVLGFGGPISTFLSFSIYQPFSRISYCVYLVHMVLQIMRMSAVRTNRFFNDMNCFNDFLVDLALSTIVGFFFTLVFESPVLILEKTVRRRGQRKLSESKRELRREKLESGIDNTGVERD